MGGPPADHPLCRARPVGPSLPHAGGGGWDVVHGEAALVPGTAAAVQGAVRAGACHGERAACQRVGGLVHGDHGSWVWEGLGCRTTRPTLTRSLRAPASHLPRSTCAAYSASPSSARPAWTREAWRASGSTQPRRRCSMLRRGSSCPRRGQVRAAPRTPDLAVHGTVSATAVIPATHLTCGTPSPVAPPTPGAPLFPSAHVHREPLQRGRQ